MNVQNGLNIIYKNRLCDEDLFDSMIIYSKLSDYCNASIEEQNEAKQYYSFLKETNIIYKLVKEKSNAKNYIDSILSTDAVGKKVNIPDNKVYDFCKYTCEIIAPEIEIKEKTIAPSSNAQIKKVNANKNGQNVNKNVNKGNAVKKHATPKKMPNNQNAKKVAVTTSKSQNAFKVIFSLLPILIVLLAILSVSSNLFGINDIMANGNRVLMFINMGMILVVTCVYTILNLDDISGDLLGFLVIQNIAIVIVYLSNYVLYDIIGSNLAMNIILFIALIGFETTVIYKIEIYGFEGSFFGAIIFLLDIIIGYIAKNIFEIVNFNSNIFDNPATMFYIFYVISLIACLIILGADVLTTLILIFDYIKVAILALLVVSAFYVLSVLLTMIIDIAFWVVIAIIVIVVILIIIAIKFC